MALARVGNHSSVLAFVPPPSQLPCNSTRRRFCRVKPSMYTPATFCCLDLASEVRSSPAVVVETKPDPVMDKKRLSIRKKILACPICYEPVIWASDPSSSLEAIAHCTLQCRTCKKSYAGNDTHLDLTINGGGKVYGEPMAASTEFYRTPFVSYIYERGWRQSFSLAGGFPGPEKEFEMMKDYLRPFIGGNIIDASCGSGMFSRLFAKSGLFSLVVSLDYSETMMQQCYQFIKQENSFPEENIILVRADIARLPFVSSTVDAVHAGAALHCWPSPSAAVAEISRVLKPGGVFVATTYILDGLISHVPFLKTIRENVAQFSGNHNFLSEKELEDLCSSCGLINFTCTRNRYFVMISAAKPA